MARSKVVRTKHVWALPEFHKVDYTKSDYTHEMWKIDFFCTQEFKPKDLKPEVLAAAKNLFKMNKEEIAKLRSFSDSTFWVVGKYCYAHNNGAKIDPKHLQSVETFLRDCVEKAVNSVEETTVKKPSKVHNIQDAMWNQIEPCVNELDLAIDQQNWDFDIKRAINSNEHTKSSQCRLIKSYFQAELNVLTQEGYSNEVYQNLGGFLQDIIVHCDAVIAETKVKRKKRVRKPPSIEKIVSKVKFQDKCGDLGLVSINPTDCVEANIVWYYNTKKRKLGFFETDEFNNLLTFKNTSFVGYGKSGEKTVRDPNLMKGIQRLSKAKMKKLYADLTTKESTPSPRTSSEMILLKKW